MIEWPSTSKSSSPNANKPGSLLIPEQRRVHQKDEQRHRDWWQCLIKNGSLDIRRQRDQIHPPAKVTVVGTLARRDVGQRHR